MDEFKPEDELKPDPSDRRPGRSRQSSDRENEPQINFDNIDLDAEEPESRPARARKERDVREDSVRKEDVRKKEATRDEREEEEYDDVDDEFEEEEPEEVAERRPPKRKKKPASKPASRQYIMMGVGVLVLLLLIIGIGSALNTPSSSSSGDQSASAEKSINLSDNSDDQSATAQNTNNGQQDVSLPPISSTPTQGQTAAAPDGQQRVEVQGDLNNALTQQQGQIDNAVNSTLPTEPATVAPVRNNNGAARQADTTQTAAAPVRQERKHAVIEAKPQATAKATAPKPVAAAPAPASAPTPAPAAPKHTETVTASAPVQAKPVAAPAATAAAPAATTAAASDKSAGDVGSLKSAPANHYTLQLSSSSNYDNLNGWAKKENLKNYVVYQTTRNGQPWYVLVSGVYASKDDAKKAVATLPADVQAKNPWAKPLHQVQTDLK